MCIKHKNAGKQFVKIVAKSYRENAKEILYAKWRYKLTAETRQKEFKVQKMRTGQN